MKSKIKFEEENKMALFELLKIREEIDSFVETLEILKEKETLKSIKKGIKDMEDENFISFDELIKKYGLEDEI